MDVFTPSRLHVLPRDSRGDEHVQTRTSLTLVTAIFVLSATVAAQDAGTKKWAKGKGWGWVWGPADEVGNLNEMTDASRLAALRLVKVGKTYDLGLPYDRESFKWVGHNSGEIISFRSPAGVRTQKDLPFTTAAGGNTGGTAWHSNALFISDNVATQIDGLAHITHGADSHFCLRTSFRRTRFAARWLARR